MVLKIHNTSNICIAVVVVVVVSCYCVAETFGFQHVPVAVAVSSGTSRTLRNNDRRYPQYYGQQHQKHAYKYFRTIDNNKLTQSSVVPSAASPTTASSSSRLYAFNNNMNMNNMNNQEPIQNWKDVVRRLSFILTTTVRQFSSGFMSGYFFAVVWGLFRGPNATNNRGLLWGCDFGALSAIFTICDMVTNLFVSTNNKQNQQKQKTVSLWNVVVRNMILAIYFGRNGGAAKMIRMAAIYGGLTYFFVSKKTNRDASTTMSSTMFNSMNMNNLNNMGGRTSGRTTAVTMEELIQRLQSQAAAANAAKANSSSTTTTTNPARSEPASATSSASSSSKKTTSANKPKLENIVDVEWEKVDNNNNNNEEDDENDNDTTK